MIIEKKGIVYDINPTTKEGIVKYSDCKIQEAKIEKTIKDCLITEIATKAFFYCRNLKKVLLPNSIKKIKNEAFSGCSKLSCIEYENLSANTISVFNIGNKAFKDCSSLNKLNLVDVKTLGKEAFANSALLFSTLPEGLEILEENVFNNCEMLNSIVLPKTMKLAKNACQGCHNMKSITIKSLQIKADDLFANINKDVLLICEKESNVNEMLMYGFTVNNK